MSNANNGQAGYSPSTPPRRVQSSHLHRRSVSRSPSSLLFDSSRTTSPTTSTSSYRLMSSSSPKRSGLAESVVSASDYLGGRGGKRKWRDAGAILSGRRIILLVALVVGLLILGERSWMGNDSIFRLDQRGKDWSLREETIDSDRIPKQQLQDDEIPISTPPYDRPDLSNSVVVPPPPSSEKMIKVTRPVRPESPPLPPPPPSSEIDEVSSSFDASSTFILVGWMGEQETKAQAHLYQLGLLALAMNRTLVLPGVRKSRFGSCYLDNDFTLYYERDTFDRFGIPYITASEFSIWLNNDKNDRRKPTAQMVSFARGEVVPIVQLDATPEHFCINDWNLDWTQHEPQAFFIPTTDWKSKEVRDRYGETVVNSLVAQDGLVPPSSSSTPSSNEGPSVIVVQYNLRFPFLTPESIATLSPYHFTPPLPYSYFPYSKHWLDLGHSIADQLSPFVGIHWRTETLEIDRIVACGIELVAQLRQIRREHPSVNTLYLATDYPIDLIRSQPGQHRLPKSGVQANSGTMTKTLTPQHHEAFKSFLRLLEGATEEESFHVTTFHEEQKIVTLPPALRELLPQGGRGGGGGGIESLDSAIAGLVDKVVLSNAELFYAGLSLSEDKLHGCGKHSQFTTQVITGRMEQLERSATEDEETRLWNNVGTFSLKSSKYL